MNDENKFESWGLSLSLKPPITNLNPNPLCKRESTESPMRSNNPLAIIPRINMGVEFKPPREIIDLEEGKVASPNSNLSNVTGKRCGGDREGGNQGDDEGDKKKLRLTREQSMVLDQTFNEHTTLTSNQKLALARQLNLKPRQVEVWFQNRRARTKSKLIEVECESLKGCVQTLTEENLRLQKEVQELRALQFSNEPANHPRTALTMCPSCKNVSFSASSSATAKTPAGETRRFPVPTFHRPTPLNINNHNNGVIKSHSPSSS